MISSSRWRTARSQEDSFLARQNSSALTPGVPAPALPPPAPAEEDDPRPLAVGEVDGKAVVDDETVAAVEENDGLVGAGEEGGEEVVREAAEANTEVDGEAESPRSSDDDSLLSRPNSLRKRWRLPIAGDELPPESPDLREIFSIRRLRRDEAGTALSPAPVSSLGLGPGADEVNSLRVASLEFCCCNSSSSARSAGPSSMAPEEEEVSRGEEGGEDEVTKLVVEERGEGLTVGSGGG